MARETVLLADLLSSHGLSPLVIKGAALAKLCYPNFALKESWDIDILVKPAEAHLALRALQLAGYSVVNPPLNELQFARFVPLAKEIELRNPVSGITVELHWRLLNAGGQLDSFDKSTQRVSLLSGSVETLDDERLFSYLCLHGAAHNWFRLKWLADVNAFFGRFSPDAQRSLIESTTKYGAGRSASVAIALCTQLFGAEQNRSSACSSRRDLISPLLIRNVVKTLGYRGSLQGPVAQRTLWRRSIFASFFATPGVVHLRNTASYYWQSASDHAAIPLPNSFKFLYHLLRVPLLVGRIGKRVIGRKGLRN